MTDRCPAICDCIEPLFVALAATEALEHNAVMSKECRSIGKNVKRLISEELFEDLSSDHGCLEYPVSEPIANMGLILSLGAIEDKCKVNVDEAHKLATEGFKLHEKSKFDLAQQEFIEVKMKLMDMAIKLCEKS